MSLVDTGRVASLSPSCCVKKEAKYNCEAKYMEYGNQFSVTKSLYDWCVENNRMDLNERFDEEKNGCTTKDVGYKSNLKWWFKCQRGIHDSEQHYMCAMTHSTDTNIECTKCNSLAQCVIDKFGQEYLDSHWSNKNLISPWDISAGSGKKVIIQCTKVKYHEYEQAASSFVKGFGCPYCINRKVHPNDSLAVLRPDIIERWSDKNKKSPYEYSLHSESKVWLKCPCGKHDDYLQKLANAYIYDYKCPKCQNENAGKMKRGANCRFWRGGINKKNDTLRHRTEYKEWRTNVYKRDDYTCQCCGSRGGKLNAHHLVPFYSCEELRYDINNGLTLCEKCHDSTKKGSFHNIYGTHNNTVEQLRKYVLSKSNIDIYITHPEFLSVSDIKLLPPAKEET